MSESDRSVISSNGKVVLLLNSTYEPIRIISWQKAVTLVFKEKVEVIEESIHVIHSARLDFGLPSVVKLKRYIKLNYHQRVRFCKENVFYRDKYTCQYCGKTFPKNELTLDHIIPASMGGKKIWENIVTACYKCNNKKGNRKLEEVNMKLLSKPKRPNFLPKVHHGLKLKKLPDEWTPYIKA